VCVILSQEENKDTQKRRTRETTNEIRKHTKKRNRENRQKTKKETHKRGQKRQDCDCSTGWHTPSEMSGEEDTEDTEEEDKDTTG
jgi:hypothetical protein